MKKKLGPNFLSSRSFDQFGRLPLRPQKNRHPDRSDADCRDPSFLRFRPEARGQPEKLTLRGQLFAIDSTTFASHYGTEAGSLQIIPLLGDWSSGNAHARSPQKSGGKVSLPRKRYKIRRKARRRSDRR